MNIAIFMAVGAGNLGDELILKNEIKILEEKYGQEKINFKVFTYDLDDQFVKKENIEYVEYFPIGIKNPKNFLKNLKNFLNFLKIIKNSDKIIFGGGGIFFDKEISGVKNPLNQWLFRKKVVSFFRKDLIFWGVSLDIKNSKNDKIIKKIFKKSSEINVRDLQSLKYLEDLGIKANLINDPVFYDAGEYPRANNMVKKIKAQDFRLFDLKDIDFKGKTVGLAFRKGFLGTNTNIGEDKLIYQIIECLYSAGAEVVFLPHSFHKIDKNSNDYVFLSKFLQDGIRISKNMQETYSYYKNKEIDFCLSMRLHSVILSQVYGINFINLKYAKKGDLI